MSTTWSYPKMVVSGSTLVISGSVTYVKDAMSKTKLFMFLSVTFTCLSSRLLSVSNTVEHSIKTVVLKKEFT